MQFTEAPLKDTDGKLLRRFNVTIPSSAFSDSVNAHLAKIGKDVRLPGFRPGKAPVSVLKQRFGQNAMSDVLQESMRKVVGDIRSKHSFRAAGEPHATLQSMGEKDDVKFELAFDLMPDIKLADFKGMSVNRPVASVDDKNIDDAIRAFGERARKLLTVSKNHPDKGDLVEMECRFDMDDLPSEREWRKFIVEIGKEQIAPGVDKVVQGLAPGAGTTAPVAFPDDDPVPGRAGKTGKVQLRLLSIKVLEDELKPETIAERVGAASVSALRERISASLAKDAERMAKDVAKRALLDQLDENHDIPVPTLMAEREFNGVWQEVQNAMQQGKLDPDDAGKSEDELKAEYRAISDRRVRLGLIMSEVGKVYGIRASDHDVNAAITAETERDPNNANAIISHFRNDPAARDRLRAPILEEKVTDFLFDLVGKQDAKFSFDELRDQWRDGSGAAKTQKKQARKKTAAKSKAGKSDDSKAADPKADDQAKAAKESKKGDSDASDPKKTPA